VERCSRSVDWAGAIGQVDDLLYESDRKVREGEGLTLKATFGLKAV